MHILYEIILIVIYFKKIHGGYFYTICSCTDYFRLRDEHFQLLNMVFGIFFLSGQVIKQKIGENEEGFAYGWTRENKLSSKQYGWYPIDIVSYK